MVVYGTWTLRNRIPHYSYNIVVRIEIYWRERSLLMNDLCCQETIEIHGSLFCLNQNNPVINDWHIIDAAHSNDAGQPG